MVIVKLINGPDDGGRQIQGHSQKGVCGQEAGEGEGQATSALSYTHHDNGSRQDEADAVHSQAPIGRCILVIRYWLTDEDEYDAGDEGLTHL